MNFFLSLFTRCFVPMNDEKCFLLWLVNASFSVLVFLMFDDVSHRWSCEMRVWMRLLYFRHAFLIFKDELYTHIDSTTDTIQKYKRILLKRRVEDEWKKSSLLNLWEKSFFCRFSFFAHNTKLMGKSELKNVEHKKSPIRCKTRGIWDFFFVRMKNS